MINQRMKGLGQEPSVIRELFAYGLERKAQIGDQNVFDFSIGNPSIPAPPQIKEAVLALMEEPAEVLHGYTPSVGTAAVREAVARDIRNKHGFPATAQRVYMTAGAAAAIAISLSALTEPGDEVILIAPFFPEYRVWIETAQCTCVPVKADPQTFQIDAAAVEAAITEKTSVVIINSPNNPVGAVYTKETLEAFCEVLRRKSQELGRALYLISDEPYRPIVFDGLEVPYLPSLYDRTVVCYSYSKAFSLPGERIGYIYVSDTMEESAELFAAVSGAGRALGFVCAPVLFQRVLETCIELPSNVDSYRENRSLLMGVLDEAGFEYVAPQGAFYLWMKSPIPDAKEFMEKAKQFELLLVPSDSFGVEGWLRLSYCVPSDTILRSAEAFKALAATF